MVKTSNSDIFRYNIVNGKLVDNYTIANGVAIGSDFHGGNGLENLLKISNENDLVAVVNGDVVNDYSFSSMAQEMGYKTQSQMRGEYFQKHLSKKDIDTYILIENLEKTGGSIEPFLQNIPESHQNTIKNQIENILKYSESTEFNKNLNDVYQNFISEKGGEIQENTIKNQIFYQIFMDEEAKNVASKLNKYSNTKVLFNKGNHENTMFVEQVRQYLNNKEQIVDLTEFEGLYSIKQDNGEKMTLAGMTNTIHSILYLSEIFGEDEKQLYSHMNIDEIKAKSILSGKKSKSDLKNLEELIKQDNDYKRVYKNGEESLDIFLTHGQIGIPNFEDSKKKGLEVPYQGIAAYLSDKAKLTIEGHIHSYYEGKNSFGDNTIRPAGKYGTIIKKDKNGNLINKKIELDSNYTGGQNNEVSYDLNLMKTKIEEMYKQIISSTPTSNNSNYTGNNSKSA